MFRIVVSYDSRKLYSNHGTFVNEFMRSTSNYFELENDFPETEIVHLKRCSLDWYFVCNSYHLKQDLAWNQLCSVSCI